MTPPQHPAITKLREALAQLGIAATLEYREEYIGFPGGGYTNKLIVVGGEQYDADLTEKNPLVTALEIKRRMR
jgi:hypothetical protein